MNEGTIGQRDGRVTCAGWHRLLDKLIGELDGRTISWSEEDQMALRERYAAMLDPQ